MVNSMADQKVPADLEGQFSVLPDDILLLILSHLKLREVARTSILCRRCRNLWKYTSGSLDFDKADHLYDPPLTEEEYESLQAERIWFVRWVNLVLKLHQISTIDEFKVCFSLDYESSDDINSWIVFALSKQVKRLVLDFESTGGPLQEKDYTLTIQPVQSCSFGSLVNLRLNGVEVSGEVLEYILSRCTLLEDLHVGWSVSLIVLKIPISLSRLKHVGIECCHSMKHLEIHAMNLSSFTYIGTRIYLYFKEIPCLVKTEFGGDYCTFLVKNVRHFSSHLSLLESLTLDLMSWTWLFSKWHGAFPKFPKFRRLRVLELVVCQNNVAAYLSFCTSLMKASSLLQKLVLRVYGIFRSEGGKINEKRERYLHHNLKVLELYGFLGDAEDIELAQHMISKLPSLEKMVVHPHDLVTKYASEKAIAAAQQLEQALPSGVQLTVT